MTTQNKTETAPTSKPRWKKMKVPTDVYEKLKAEAKKQNLAVWQYVMKLYANAKETEKTRQIRGEKDAVERAAWYSFKLSQSVGQLKSMPNNRNYELLMDTISEIEKRLKVDVTELRVAAASYMRSQDKGALVALNEAAKLVTKRILLALLAQ